MRRSVERARQAEFRSATPIRSTGRNTCLLALQAAGRTHKAVTVAAWAGSRDTHLAGLDMAVTVAARAGNRDTHLAGLDMAVMVAVRGTRPAVEVGPRAEAWA